MPVPNDTVTATPADAKRVDENFAALDARLKDLEGAAKVGVAAEVDTYSKVDGAANDQEIALDDPTRGALVTVEFYGQGADASAKLQSWAGIHEDIVAVPATGKATATFLASPGETYSINRNFSGTAGADPQVSAATEKPIG